MTDNELETRLARLEAKLAALSLDDLPMSSIRRKLEHHWEDASHIQQGSLGPELLKYKDQPQAIYGAGGNSPNYNNLQNASAPLVLSNGTVNMELKWEAPTNCLLRVDAHTLWDSPDQIISAITWGVRLTPSDADGRSLLAHGQPVDPAWGPSGGTLTANFKLAAGTVYTLALVFVESRNHNQFHSRAPEDLWLEGTLTGFGAT